MIEIDANRPESVALLYSEINVSSRELSDVKFHVKGSGRGVYLAVIISANSEKLWMRIALSDDIRNSVLLNRGNALTQDAYTMETIFVPPESTINFMLEGTDSNIAYFAVTRLLSGSDFS